MSTDWRLARASSDEKSKLIGKLESMQALRRNIPAFHSEQPVEERQHGFRKWPSWTSLVSDDQAPRMVRLSRSLQKPRRSCRTFDRCELERSVRADPSLEQSLPSEEPA